MDRKLVSIQKIVDVQPIKGYDRVEYATVLGWKCITSKADNFKPGDYCAYFEIDSKLTPTTTLEFLAKRNWRVKTLKMCGVVSQGLIVPIDKIEEMLGGEKYELVEGYDLTESLGVKHYDKINIDKVPQYKNVPKNKFVKFMFKYRLFRIMYRFIYGINAKNGLFPKKIVKESDETNIQNIPNTIKNNIDQRMYVTEKLEGQSATYMISPKTTLFGKDKYHVCSHHRRIPHEDNSSWWTISKQFNIQTVLDDYIKKYGIYLSIQGEIIGNGIQKNIYHIDGYDFYVFNIKNLNTGKYLTLSEKEEVCEELNLKHVPIITTLYYMKDDTTVDDILEMSNGKSELYDTIREGLVIRKFDNDKISFKAKSPNYLLTNKN